MKETSWVLVPKLIKPLSYSRFNSISRNLDLSFENPYFEGRRGQSNCPPDLHLNKANTSHTDAPIVNSCLSASNGFV